MRTRRLWTVLDVAIASIVLGLASAATMHAVGLFAHQRRFPAAPPSCAAPALPGTSVDVTVTDMGMMGPGMMGAGMMGPGAGGTYGAGTPRGGYPWPGVGIMRLQVNPTIVPAGPASLRVTNIGAMIHEVVVLPLRQGQAPR